MAQSVKMVNIADNIDKFKYEQAAQRPPARVLPSSRSTSHDDRLKAKTKKHRQPEQERRQDYPSSPPPSPQGNLELLLGVAQSMAAVARKYPEVRFKASDQKLLSLTITELTLLRQL